MPTLGVNARFKRKPVDIGEEAKVGEERAPNLPKGAR